MPEQNNKLKLVRAVMLCVTLAIMAAIFLFSAQPGESSSALSQQITEKVESTAAHRMTPKWFSSQNDNANIRKWAHVYIYCALGVSTAVTVHLFGSAGKAGGAKQLVQEALISAVTCTAYAGTDEFHQLFIPGRAGMIQDVGVDALEVGRRRQVEAGDPLVRGAVRRAGDGHRFLGERAGLLWRPLRPAGHPHDYRKLLRTTT